MDKNKISLLDCTLRDGGYVNDWNFGNSTIVSVLDRLIEANVEVIEVGFLDERQTFNVNRTIQPNTECYNKLLADVDRKNSLLVAMIDYGTCGIESIAPCSESLLDGIRVIFKKSKMKAAVAFGQQLVALGYKVFLQLVSVTSYSDRDMLDLIDLVNEYSPFAVSMVDTYGLMHKEEMLNYFYLLDHNLKPEIRIGYHSHNNFQLAYANTCELLKRTASHDILVDGTLYGMGKSAGNAPLELLAMYLNENYGKEYDLNQILEAIDTNILRLYHQHYWGYNLLYFLAASNDCHPNYINYLLSKKSLSVGAINEIVKKIPLEMKLNFTRSCIEQLYVDYQIQTSQGDCSLHALGQILYGRSLLVLGPGKSLLTYREKIELFVQNKKPLIIAVNFIPVFLMTDFIFISNAKRYSMLLPQIGQMGKELSLIATSNITAVGKKFDYILNYVDLHNENRLIEDNALIMLLKALGKCKPSLVTLAGFDGFGQEINQSYYDDSLELSTDYKRLSEINRAIADILPEFEQQMTISFLTPSIYAQKGIDNEKI